MNRTRSLVFTGLGVLTCALSMCQRWTPRLLYNPTASAPRGWYWVERTRALQVGDLAVVRLPPEVATFAAERRYLPLEVPLLKRVAAVGGQRVCAADDRLYVDATPVADVLRLDAIGRALPIWSGCRSLDNGELLLIGDHAASFDSRYFGPVRTSSVEGRALALHIR